MADEPDRGENEILRDALTRCAKQIKINVGTNNITKALYTMAQGYTFNNNTETEIMRFVSLLNKVIFMLGDMRQNFIGGIDNLITYKEKLNTMILELEQHTDELILGMRDSCIGFINDVIQLIDEQILRLRAAQRGGRRKSRTRKIKKQTRRLRSRSKSKSRSRRN